MIPAIRAAIITLPLVFGPAALAGAIDGGYDPHVLTLTLATGAQVEIAATNATTCAAAMRAIHAGRWVLADMGERVVGMTCRLGDRFARGSTCIAGYNCAGK